jgi:hypothetical protein
MKKKLTKTLLVLGAIAALSTASMVYAVNRYPNINAAIGALNRAIADLNRAPHDFGGHKADALQACQNAITQLQAAKAWNEAHPNGQ